MTWKVHHLSLFNLFIDFLQIQRQPTLYIGCQFQVNYSKDVAKGANLWNRSWVQDLCGSLFNLGCCAFDIVVQRVEVRIEVKEKVQCRRRWCFPQAAVKEMFADQEHSCWREQESFLWRVYGWEIWGLGEVHAEENLKLFTFWRSSSYKAVHFFEKFILQSS